MQSFKSVASHSSAVSGLLRSFNLLRNSANIGSPILLYVFGNSNLANFFSIAEIFFFCINVLRDSNVSISLLRESLC